MDTNQVQNGQHCPWPLNMWIDSHSTEAEATSSHQHESADAWVDFMLNSTGQCQNLFLACWQSSFNEFLQQLPKQSQWAECLQCWDSKALILGQDIRHSLSFHVSTETLFSFYVTSHVFEWATTTDCLGLLRLKCGLQYHSTSCYSEQMETVQLWFEQVPPTVNTAPCLQRCHCMLVIFGLPHHL